MFLQQVHECSRKFKSGVPSVEDASRQCQPHRLVTNTAEAPVKTNRPIALEETATILNISVGSVDNIVRGLLQFKIVSARWVPHQLTAELRDRRVNAYEELLRHLKVECDRFLERFITGDETWVSITRVLCFRINPQNFEKDPPAKFSSIWTYSIKSKFHCKNVKKGRYF